MSTDGGRIGRPRSEEARLAILHAVDDLLVEQGYAAMTLKGIAQRAGVSRQTIYRWWSTKAEILVEASVGDAHEELEIVDEGSAHDQIAAFIAALIRFLTASDAGLAYRALLGEAQHDHDVAQLIATQDILGASARKVIDRAFESTELALPIRTASAQLIGPVLYCVLSGRDPRDMDTTEFADAFMRLSRGPAVTR